MKTKIEEQIKNFAVGFFNNLKCGVLVEDDCVIVENVPKSFEDFLGKKSPYCLVFSKEDETEETELVAKGNYFLNAMRSFLDKSGSTTLLKIDFNEDSQEKALSNYNFKNSEIDSVKKVVENTLFSRFTFLTTFQYLNEKEQIVNEVYIHNGGVVEGNLEGYKVSEGKKEDVSASKIEEDYNIAKENIKIKLQKKTKEISRLLDKSLDKEVKRIKEHYRKQVVESRTGLIEELKKLKGIEEKLVNSSEEEKKKIEVRIDKTLKKIERLNDEKELERIEREREIVMNDEKQKHGLNIHNKLINTTVIYYPVQKFKVLLKNENVGRIIEISYNPLTKETSSLFCEACKNKLNKVYLCSSGHVCCGNCIGKCFDCGKEFCESCLKKQCDFCGAKLCRECINKCFDCGKDFCQNHLKTDCVSGDEKCINCLKFCQKCQGYSSPKYFRTNEKGEEMCQKCFGKEVGKRVVRGVFD